MSEKGVVIVGAGQAGCSAAAKLRALGHDGPVTLVGEEAYLPYQRPPLSKAYLLGEMEAERLHLRAPSFYEEQNITALVGEKVTAIDREACRIALAERELPYWQLILTTGSLPRRLPAAIGGNLEGAYTIRSITDIDGASPKFKAGRKLLVVGGGYIGLEVAAVARKLGLEVTLVEAAPRILQRVAAKETSDYFRALHESHGVTILEGVGLERLLGEERVTGARLANGAVLEADFAVLGIGIAPDTALAEAAGLKIDNGIWTDAFGRTSDPNIWAAGDCASFPYGEERIRLESVGNAIDQAEAVAANIMGRNEAYRAKPWFWSDQYDVKLQIAGLNSGYDSLVVRQTSDHSQSFWYYSGERLLAVDAMNDPRGYMVAKRLIELGRSPDKAQVADPQSNLKALLKG
ncbi:MAG: FAD-dependent oxidoreductase [Kiloniellales bacterium]